MVIKADLRVTCAHRLPEGGERSHVRGRGGGSEQRRPEEWVGALLKGKQALEKDEQM